MGKGARQKAAKAPAAQPKRVNWAQAFAGAMIGLILATLAAIYLTPSVRRWLDARRAVPSAACLLLQELEINQRTSESRHALITNVALEYRQTPGRRETLDKLLELKYQHFGRNVYDDRKADLAFFPPTSGKHVEGVYAVMSYIDQNEPGLVDTVLRDRGKEDYHLRAMLGAYSELEDKVFPMTRQSLKELCYRSR